MNSASQDVKDMLETAGLGTFAASSGWSIHVGRQPVEPDDCITIYEAGDQSAADPDNNLYHPLIQIRVRGDDYLGAINKALAIRDELLVNQVNSTVNSTLYLGFWSVGGITPIGWDEQDRPQFTMNFSLMRQDNT